MHVAPFFDEILFEKNENLRKIQPNVPFKRTTAGDTANGTRLPATRLCKPQHALAARKARLEYWRGTAKKRNSNFRFAKYL